MTAGAEPYGSVKGAALAVKGERIAWIGAAGAARDRAAAGGVPVHEVGGLWMTPGLIDCHTHLIYGGNRVAEFEQRLCGASYEDIARAGGGIQSTVRATRAATYESLRASAAARARRVVVGGRAPPGVKTGSGRGIARGRGPLRIGRDMC